MNMLPNRNKIQTTMAGYMLVEMLVSLSVFALIAVSTTAALLTIIDANAKSQAMRAAMDNLNVAIDTMSRSLRIGSDFRCGDWASGAFSVIGENTSGACQAGTAGISFLPQDSTGPTDRVFYYWKQDTDANGNAYGAIYRYRNGVTTVLTSPDVNIGANVNNTTINGRLFYLVGANTVDGQPRVLFNISGKAGLVAQTQTAFIIQTTVTERQPDCDDSSCVK